MATLQTIEEFLNTLDERTFRRHGESHVAGEQLTSPQALSDWLAARGLAAAGTELRPADLTAATALRRAIRQALTGTATALESYPLRLGPDPSGGLRLVARSERPWLDVIIETVAKSVAGGDWKRLKFCAAPDCRWAFHDTSRSGQGRWCSMEVCGNRHKTRTYRERRQHAGQPAGGGAVTVGR